MSVGTMTSKGQITIPKDVRQALGLRPGVTVSFTRNADGDYVMRAAHQSAADLAGALPYSGPNLSVADMADAVALGALGR